MEALYIAQENSLCGVFLQVPMKTNMDIVRVNSHIRESNHMFYMLMLTKLKDFFCMFLMRHLVKALDNYLKLSFRLEEHNFLFRYNRVFTKLNLLDSYLLS